MHLINSATFRSSKLQSNNTLTTDIPGIISKVAIHQ